MHVDSCGCLWDWEGDILNILPCESCRDQVERAKRIAWKMVARRNVSFREAWGYLALKFIGRMLRSVTCSLAQKR
jgi:hypothetical protein